MGGIGLYPIPGSSLLRRLMADILALAYALGVGADDFLSAPLMEKELREAKPRKLGLLVACFCGVCISEVCEVPGMDDALLR